MLTERKARNATVDYLQQVQTALISYAANNGRLPWADSDADGAENSGAGMGTLPYLTLQMAPADAYKRHLRYKINANLAASRTATCSALRAGLAIRPQVVDADGTATAFSRQRQFIQPHLRHPHRNTQRRRRRQHRLINAAHAHHPGRAGCDAESALGLQAFSANTVVIGLKPRSSCSSVKSSTMQKVAMITQDSKYVWYLMAIMDLTIRPSDTLEHVRLQAFG